MVVDNEALLGTIWKMEEQQVDQEQLVTLQYIDNAVRKTIAEIDISKFESRTVAAEYMLRMLQEEGFNEATDSRKLHVVELNIPFENCECIPNHATVMYSAVIAPNCAVGFDKDGIYYAAYSSEKSHLEYPHIHAKYSGEEISIYLNDFHIDGKMRSKKKEKEAIEYVRRNVESFLEMWEAAHGK